jgi:hypothetical protein
MADINNTNNREDVKTFLKSGDATTEGTFPLDMGSGPYEPSSFHVDVLMNAFRDLARPNQYKVWMKPPQNVSWDHSVEILAKSAVIPSIEIEDIEWERAGAILHIPGNKMNYGDVTITFWVDDTYNARSMFNVWQNTIFNWSVEKEVDKNSTLTASPSGPYPAIAWSGEVEIWVYNAKRKAAYMVKLTNCWPKNISEISLAQDSTDQVAEFSVTFAYTHQKIYNPAES